MIEIVQNFFKQIKYWRYLRKNLYFHPDQALRLLYDKDFRTTERYRVVLLLYSHGRDIKTIAGHLNLPKERIRWMLVRLTRKAKNEGVL